MVESLDEMIRTQHVSGSDIPAGVRRGVEEFFKLVIQGAQEDKSAPNPLASMNAYGIALDAMSESSRPFNEVRDLISGRLVEFSRFAERLSQPRSLHDDEVRVAYALRDFFSQLREGGESEAYERAVSLDYTESSPRPF
jgi:hypothetical protein